MANAPTQTSRDWLGSVHTSLLAWWMPKAAIVAGLFVPASFRAVIWIIALIWMGTACILNARRCNRTHCRYTGPYYLAMIVPVMAFAAGLVTVGILGWVCLGVIMLGGSGLIWWATDGHGGSSLSMRADILRDVCCGSSAEVEVLRGDVRVTLESRHRTRHGACVLRARSCPAQT